MSPITPDGPMSAPGIEAFGTPPPEACSDSTRPTIGYERVGLAAHRGDGMEAVRHRLRRHGRVQIDDGRLGRRRCHEGVVGAFEDVADQVVGVSQGVFDVVVAPAGSVESTLTQFIVVMVGPPRRWCRWRRG